MSVGVKSQATRRPGGALLLANLLLQQLACRLRGLLQSDWRVISVHFSWSVMDPTFLQDRFFITLPRERSGEVVTCTFFFIAWPRRGVHAYPIGIRTIALVWLKRADRVRCSSSCLFAPLLAMLVCVQLTLTRAAQNQKKTMKIDDETMMIDETTLMINDAKSRMTNDDEVTKVDAKAHSAYQTHSLESY